MDCKHACGSKLMCLKMPCLVADDTHIIRDDNNEAAAVGADRAIVFDLGGFVKRRGNFSLQPNCNSVQSASKS